MSAIALLPAHGVGSRQDLPLPFGLLLTGAALALVISFLALGLLWKQPRLRPTDGRLLPPALALALDSPAVRGAFGALSLALTGLDPAGAPGRQGRRQQPRALRGLRLAVGGPGLAVDGLRRRSGGCSTLSGGCTAGSSRRPGSPPTSPWPATGPATGLPPSASSPSPGWS